MRACREGLLGITKGNGQFFFSLYSFFHASFPVEKKKGRKKRERKRKKRKRGTLGSSSPPGFYQRAIFLSFLLRLYLHVRRRSGTRDNLDKLAGNDGLTGSVEQDLVLGDHLTSVLGGVLYVLVSVIIRLSGEKNIKGGLQRPVG
jgi:hypothetical protein